MPLPSALPSALVIDLDGTLVDSAADLANAVNALLREMQLPEVSDEAVRGMIGNGLGMLAMRALLASGAEPTEADVPVLGKRLLRHYLNPTDAPQTKVFPGVIETLIAFQGKGIKLGLCTNKAQAATEMVLHKTGLASFFDSVVGHDRAPTPKPSPAHVQAVLADLGNPSDAVMVGDSAIDLAAGRSAGLPVVLMTYGYGTPEALATADATISHFADLPEALAQLSR
ncbi:MAG: HAD-IA family hydrolase [Alphaproteobacteria bacterium]